MEPEFATMAGASASASASATKEKLKTFWRLLGSISSLLIWTCSLGGPIKAQLNIRVGYTSLINQVSAAIF